MFCFLDFRGCSDIKDNFQNCHQNARRYIFNVNFSLFSFLGQICANWYNWYDPESGIFSYLWAVGTQPGLSNVVDFVKLSRREHTACSGYVTLQHGETYYSTLVAFHGGYDKLNVSGTSNGG